MGLLSCLTLIGCATTSQYQTKLSSLVGQPENALIAQWGKPTGRYTDENGDEVIAYIRTREILIPNTPTFEVNGGGVNSVFSGVGGNVSNHVSTSANISNGSIQLNCMTKFIMKNGVVSSSTFKGNDCKSRNW